MGGKELYLRAKAAGVTKLILSLRDPAERTWSAYQMNMGSSSWSRDMAQDFKLDVARDVKILGKYWVP
jgi:hypothetical protein